MPPVVVVADAGETDDGNEVALADDDDDAAVALALSLLAAVDVPIVVLPLSSPPPPPLPIPSSLASIRLILRVYHRLASVIVPALLSYYVVLLVIGYWRLCFAEALAGCFSGQAG